MAKVGPPPLACFASPQSSAGKPAPQMQNLPSCKDMREWLRCVRTLLGVAMSVTWATLCSNCWGRLAGGWVRFLSCCLDASCRRKGCFTQPIKSHLLDSCQSCWENSVSCGDFALRVWNLKGPQKHSHALGPTLPQVTPLSFYSFLLTCLFVNKWLKQKKMKNKK